MTTTAELLAENEQLKSEALLWKGKWEEIEIKYRKKSEAYDRVVQAFISASSSPPSTTALTLFAITKPFLRKSHIAPPSLTTKPFCLGILDLSYLDFSMMSILRRLPFGKAGDLYKSLLAVKEKPHVMDRETLDRAIILYEKEQDMDTYFEEQLRRWKNTNPDKVTSQELVRLEKVRARYECLGRDIISLSKELKMGCIDSILEMDAAEAGLNFMMGNFKL